MKKALHIEEADTYLPNLKLSNGFVYYSCCRVGLTKEVFDRVRSDMARSTFFQRVDKID